MNTSVHELVVPRLSLSDDWKAFADRLAAALPALGEDQSLIVAVESRPRFVQFSGSGAEGLRAETVSNAYLAAADQLSDDQVAVLIAAGWRRPTHAPDANDSDKDPVGSPNFFADFEVPVPFDEVADLAVRTLAEVFEVPHPDLLEYDAFEITGSPISFPGLCRRQAQRPDSTAEADHAFAQALLAAIREVTGMGELEFDEDGDVCLPWWSQVFFVRRLSKTPFLRIWSPLLAGIAETPEMLKQINLLNAGAGLVRYSVYDGVVFAEADVPADPIVVKHVDLALRGFYGATDGVDVMLQRQFGGRTAFIDLPPGALPH